MTLDDFSTGFDTLLNSYATTASFGRAESPISIELDEFEKSQFLTYAQKDYALGIYTGKNTYGESFEQTEEIRRYLAPLVTEAELNPITNNTGNPIGMDGSNSYFFSLPDGTGAKPAVWFITYESVTITDSECSSHTSLEVTPAKQDEYSKLKKNPFRGANNRRALRLDLNDDVIEIVSKYPVTKYYIRYLKKLKPIVLINLGTENSIEGVNVATECELPDSVHRKILEIAVQKAIQSRGLNSSENK